MTDDDDDDTQVYKRSWVGLTDEEIEKAYWQGHFSLLDFGRAIEAKLKERNAWQ